MRAACDRWPASPRPGALALLATCLLAGCGKGAVGTPSGGPVSRLAPLAPQGAVSLSTGNTTRLGGSDPATDAAAVARAIYPGLTARTRPSVVVLVDERSWADALVSSALASAPTGAAILYADGGSLPEVTEQALRALHPTGASSLGGAQVIRVGTSSVAPVPSGYVARSLLSREPSVTAAAVEGLLVASNGSAPHQVIIVPTNGTPALTMPAAGLAAQTGAPILLVTSARLPQATAAVLAGLHHPSIYVADPAQVSRLVIARLRRFGTVSTIPSAGDRAEASDPVTNAIAVARFTDGSFGWGVKEPGHGLVFANASRPLDGPAAAPLSASAEYGPLLLVQGAAALPTALAAYLGDIQPAYTSAPNFRAVKGVYNHGWLIGDEQALSAVTQAELDSLLAISPRKQAAEETSGTQGE